MSQLDLRRLSLTCVGIGMLLAPAHGQCPSWSSEFAPNRTAGAVTAVRLDESGAGPRLIVAGGLTTVAGVPVRSVAEYDGVTWSPLGAGVAFPATAIAVGGASGAREVYVGGSGELRRWDGASWTDLGLDAGFVQALEVYDDGSGPALYVAGSDLRAGTVGQSLLLRYDGAWTSVVDDFAASPPPFISALTVHDDGTGERLYVGGRFTGLGGVPGANLLRYDSSGFQPAGPPGGLPPILSGFRQVTALASSRRAGQRVLHVGLGGAAATAQGPSSWLVEGAGAWIGLDETETIRGLSVERRGAAADAVWALTSDGIRALDGALQPLVSNPPGALGFVSGVAAFPGVGGPEIWVGSAFEYLQDSPLAYWDGMAWNLPGGDGEGPPFDVRELVEHDFGAGPELVALTGQFGSRPIFRYDGVRWTEIPTVGVTNTEAIVSHLGKLYVSSQGAPVHRLDGAQWTPIDSGVGSFLGVDVIASVDVGAGPELYIGGSFDDLTRPGTKGIARLEGSHFVSVGGGLDPVLGFDTVGAIVGWDDGGGNDLYVGGGFQSIGGVAAENVARWTGSAWEPLPGGPRKSFIGFNDDAVLDLVAGEVGSQRLLFASGIFDRLGSAPSTGLAAWDGTTWFSIDGGPGDPVRFDGRPGSPEIHDPDGRGHRLYLTGDFETPAGTVYGIGCWDGAVWELAPGLAPPSPPLAGVDALLSADRGAGRALIAAGAFDQIGGTVADRVASLTDPCGRVVGLPFCTALANSTGGIATSRASGSGSLSANDLVLHLEGAPPGSFALFALGPRAVAPAPLGTGRLCLGGALERILPPGSTSATGSYAVALDPSAPYAAAAAPGVTLFVQAFFRDVAPTGAVLGSSDGLAIRFMP